MSPCIHNSITSGTNECVRQRQAVCCTLTSKCPTCFYSGTFPSSNDDLKNERLDAVNTGSSHLQDAAARLRSAELERVQQQAELELYNIAALRQEREAEGASSHVTALLRNRQTARRKKLRTLLAMWTPYYSFEQPDAVVPDYEEEDLFRGILPWQPASDPRSASRDSFQLSFHQVGAELARCQEELEFLPGDAHNVLQT